MLEKEVEKVLREELEGVRELVLCEERFSEFIFTLLCDKTVIGASRGREMEKLSKLIKRKREAHLRATAKEALGDNHGISDDELDLLLKDKKILEATKAYKVNREKNDLVAMQAAGHFLFRSDAEDSCGADKPYKKASELTLGK